MEPLQQPSSVKTHTPAAHAVCVCLFELMTQLFCVGFSDEDDFIDVINVFFLLYFVFLGGFFGEGVV